MENILTNNIIILSLYLIILLLIAFYASTKSKSHEGFLLGDRSLNSFTSAISAGASDMSGWLLLGLPGSIYAFGINQTWIVIGLIIGAYCNWTYVAEKLRRISHDLKVITIPDFISKITNTNNSSIRIISSIMILIFFTIYVASGFVSGAKVFGQYFDISYNYGLLLTFLAVVVTTFIGGFLAITWSELLQGLIMVAVIIILPVIAYFHVPSDSSSIVLSILKKDSHMLDMFYNTNLIGILSLLAWGLGYFGQPHILSKFMAMKNSTTSRNARYIAMIWMILGLGFAVLIGLFGAIFFVDIPLKDPELVMLELSNILLHPWFIGIIIIAILSAIFSTANAQLLVISSVFTNDLKIIKKSVTMNRIVILIVGIFAIILSLDPNARVLSMVGYAWAGFGACFGPIIILSLNYKKKISSNAALSGIIIGGLSVILWNICRKYFPNTDIFTLYELLPAFIASFSSIIFVNSFFTKGK
jgi:sodium/proline symporter